MPLSLPQTNRSPNATRARRNHRLPSFIDDDEATLVLDDDGTIVHISTGARRLLDLSTRSLAERNFFRRIPRDNLERVAQTLMVLSSRKEGRATGLLQVKTGLGPWQWFKVEMTPRRCYEDKPGVILHLFERGCRRPRG